MMIAYGVLGMVSSPAASTCVISEASRGTIPPISYGLSRSYALDTYPTEASTSYFSPSFPQVPVQNPSRITEWEEGK
ncbi:uncharacterized protein B0H18DRAFT_988306 [Fomitopsis serialis]|uniref:uncharacterized protein n=1 Tax=Fomitopsis serialis TaxID=139415 RepID=UPI002007807B|nr:uncharacterized protein B0H18DRAFT_988306 [Neoantrodia serialis]KAH9931866.1 hypothetical protein B0H18DRAFT_988306 [Neoantrodia serialis]